MIANLHTIKTNACSKCSLQKILVTENKRSDYCEWQITSRNNLFNISKRLYLKLICYSILRNVFVCCSYSTTHNATDSNFLHVVVQLLFIIVKHISEIEYFHDKKLHGIYPRECFCPHITTFYEYIYINI